MRVLVACEFSGRVRDAFIAHGHDAISCDLIPSEKPGPHIRGNVLDVLGDNWDLMVAFPPCTYLAASGAQWHYGSREQFAALQFVAELMRVPYRYAIENPTGAISTIIRDPNQRIQPWQYGHKETKSTGLWLKGLKRLKPTNIVHGPYRARVHRASQADDRWKTRSRTLSGIADAMAVQWGDRINGWTENYNEKMAPYLVAGWRPW